jgi:hypothetical protein
VYECWANAGLWHDAALNVWLHCTPKHGSYPEPSGLKITLIGERLAQIDVLPFSIPTSVGTAMSCPEAEVIH